MNNYLKSKLRLNDLIELNLVNLDTPEYNSIVKYKAHFSTKQQSYYQYNIGDSHIDMTIGKDNFCIEPKFKGEHNYINLATSIFSMHKLGFAHTALAIKESINSALHYTESIGKKLNTMVTEIGLRGFEKIAMTVSQLSQGVHNLMLAAEQVGYEDPKTIIECMIGHLPHSYKKRNILKAYSRKEGIRGLLNVTEKIMKCFYLRVLMSHKTIKEKNMITMIRSTLKNYCKKINFETL